MESVGKSVKSNKHQYSYQPVNSGSYEPQQYNGGYDRYDGNPLGDDTFTRHPAMSFLHYCCMLACFPCIPMFGRTVEQGTRLEHHDLAGRLTVLNPGFHVRTPFIESFGQTIQMRDSTVCAAISFSSHF
jgi:hypothetical protein